MREDDEVILNYFVVCDQVIAEAHTNKQSIIGIYSVMAVERLPFQMTLGVALGARVQSGRPRNFHLSMSGPDGAMILQTPTLPVDWRAVDANLRALNVASIQMGVYLRNVPMNLPGVYNFAAYCDEQLLATYAVGVVVAQQPPAPPPDR